MRKTVNIVGGGVCALMLGCELNPEKFDVTVYEHNAALGRKFLVAGDGGLNLTHSESEADFIERYTPSDFLREAFLKFSNQHLRSWLHQLGVETQVGSSGRVFPEKNIKPISVLNHLLKKLNRNGVTLQLKYEWTGFSENNQLLFTHNGAQKEIKSDYVVFCLGGASWPVTGSTGDWASFFRNKNISINPFQSSNCAFKIRWPDALIKKVEGKILKNINIRCGEQTHAGEVVITEFGMEGSGIYPLSPAIRKELQQYRQATIYIDLKPLLSEDRLLEKLLSKKATGNFTEHVKAQLNLNVTHLALLKQFVSKEEFQDAKKLCHHIKHLPIPITGLGPLADAISSAGGISLQEIGDHFELKKMPAHFAVGEMLDYDAPTGGYLLQSCFSMGKYVADHLNNG